jgi:predicted thioesterase
MVQSLKSEKYTHIEHTRGRTTVASDTNTFQSDHDVVVTERVVDVMLSVCIHLLLKILFRRISGVVRDTFQKLTTRSTGNKPSWEASSDSASQMFTIYKGFN